MCNCNQCGCGCSCCTAQIAFQTINAVGGAGVAGATFALYKNGVILQTATSDALGNVAFSAVPKGCYQLQQIAVPAGYEIDTTLYPVRINCNCTVYIAGILMADFVFITPIIIVNTITVTKTSAISGALLSGATFALYNAGVLYQQQITDINGQAAFSGLAAGIYSLVELVAPAGYAINQTAHTVVVAASGDITIDGVLISTITVPNTPLEA